MKICKTCNTSKSEDEFYNRNSKTNQKYPDCKKCYNQKCYDRQLQKKISSPEWHEYEKARRRKYYNQSEGRYDRQVAPDKRRDYNQRYVEKYPEKYEARKAAQYIRPKIIGNHLHHWSYDSSHYKDVIELSPSVHKMIHRYLEYSSDHKCYKTTSGELLDTRERHVEYCILKTGYNPTTENG